MRQIILGFLRSCLIGHLVHRRKVQPFFSIIFSSVESNNIEASSSFSASLFFRGSGPEKKAIYFLSSLLASDQKVGEKDFRSKYEGST